MRIRSATQHAFSMIPNAEIPRSSFDRSHNHKTTLYAGWLTPIFVDEVLPGDTFNCSMTGFARFATPIVPLMDNMYLETFFFFVPYRLVWTNWERFNGAQDDPDDSTDYLMPYISFVAADSAINENGIGDYFGLPLAVDQDVSSLPFRAYNLIYNEWFRDQNLQDSLPVLKTDGPDPVANYALVRRGKRHDYFTSCLPWPQKGDSVPLPLTGDANVLTSATEVVTGAQAGLKARVAAGGVPLSNLNMGVTSGGNVMLMGAGTAGSEGVYFSNLVADLGTATAVTINQLRQAFQIQRLLERDARGGTRYTEIIRSHFGVTSPDARLQRPEYLGGGSSRVSINPVAQTSSTDATTPQGNLSAFGTVHMNNHGFVKSFTEHGVIIGVACIRADLNYQQGINRMWSRRTRYDHYWPALSHIGEQAVLNKEIYAQGTSADEEVFGYQERYAEYRYKPSLVTGSFRSTAAAPLDVWHLAQDFTALPTLGSTFIQENPPVSRVIAVDTEPHFLFDSYFSLRCARPMPLFGVPGLIDHF